MDYIFILYKIFLLDSWQQRTICQWNIMIILRSCRVKSLAWKNGQSAHFHVIHNCKRSEIGYAFHCNNKSVRISSQRLQYLFSCCNNCQFFFVIFVHWLRLQLQSEPWTIIVTGTWSALLTKFLPFFCFQICTYFTDPLMCVGPVASAHVRRGGMEHTAGEKRVSGHPDYHHLK